MLKIIVVIAAVWMLDAQITDIKVNTSMPILSLNYQEGDVVSESANIMETYYYPLRMTQYEETKHKSCQI